MDHKSAIFVILLMGVILMASCSPAVATQSPTAQIPSATFTLIPPSDTQIPPTPTETSTTVPPTSTFTPTSQPSLTPTTTSSPTPSVPYVFVRIYPNDGSMADQLAEHAQKASMMSFTPVHLFDAPW